MCNFTRAAMLLVAVVGCSVRTHGQSPSYSAPLFYAAGGPFSRVAVLDAPFSADATTRFRRTRPDGSIEDHTLTARYYRDSLGRVRAELDTPWGEYVVLDLRRGPWPGMRDIEHTDGSWSPKAFYVLDPAKRTYRAGGEVAAWSVFNGEGRVALPVGKVCFQWAPRVAGTSDAERLAAVNAKVAEDLGVVIASHRSDAIGSVEYVLTNIRRDESPGELFVVPPDYRFVMGSIDDPDPVIGSAPWEAGRLCRPIPAR